MTSPVTKPFQIGALIFPRIDQCDFTGPFEILSRIPNSEFHVLWKDKTPVRDAKGLILTPEMTLAEAPPLDLLLIPGGVGQHDLMEDEAVLNFIRQQSVHAKYVLSVCTGALTCGAAGLLKGRRATTHWASFHLLKYFGAVPVNERVVIDGKLVSAAGVTAGIDGSLRVVSLLCGDQVAQEIQLYMQYAPEPPFNCGTPETAPSEVLKIVQSQAQPMSEKRIITARRIAEKLGVSLSQ